MGMYKYQGYDAGPPALLFLPLPGLPGTLLDYLLAFVLALAWAPWSSWPSFLLLPGLPGTLSDYLALWLAVEAFKGKAF